MNFSAVSKQTFQNRRRAYVSNRPPHSLGVLQLQLARLLYFAFQNKGVYNNFIGPLKKLQLRSYASNLILWNMNCAYVTYESNLLCGSGNITTAKLIEVLLFALHCSNYWETNLFLRQNCLISDQNDHCKVGNTAENRTGNWVPAVKMSHKCF